MNKRAACISLMFLALVVNAVRPEQTSGSKQEVNATVAFELTTEEKALIEKNANTLLFIGPRMQKFFQYMLYSHNNESVSNVEKHITELARSVCDGNRIVDARECIDALIYARQHDDRQLRDCADECLRDVNSVSISFVPDGMKCELYVCADALDALCNRLPGLLGSANSQVSPPHRRLIVGSLYVTHGMNVKGCTSFVDKVFCAQDVLLDQGRALYVDEIKPRTPGGTITIEGLQAQSGTQGEQGSSLNLTQSLTVDNDVSVGNNISALGQLQVDRIVPKTSGPLQVASVRVDPTKTLFVDTIAPSTPGGSVSIPNFTSQTHNVTGNLVVAGDIVADRIEPEILAHTEFAGIKIDASGPFTTDRIGATSGNEVAFESDVSIEPGNALFVDALVPSTPGGSIQVLDLTSQVLQVTDNLSVGGTVETQRILASGGLTVDEDLRVIGSLFSNTITPTFGSHTTFSDSINVVNDIQINGFTIHSSDERMKENIAPILPDDSLKRVSQLTPRTYTIKKEYGGDSSIHRGLIAQEVEKVIPEVVFSLSDDLHKQDSECLKGIDYSRLIVDLVGAVKALQQQIQELQTKGEE